MTHLKNKYLLLISLCAFFTGPSVVCAHYNSGTIDDSAVVQKSKNKKRRTNRIVLCIAGAVCVIGLLIGAQRLKKPSTKTESPTEPVPNTPAQPLAASVQLLINKISSGEFVGALSSDQQKDIFNSLFSEIIGLGKSLKLQPFLRCQEDGHEVFYYERELFNQEREAKGRSYTPSSYAGFEFRINKNNGTLEKKGRDAWRPLEHDCKLGCYPVPGGPHASIQLIWNDQTKKFGYLELLSSAQAKELGL